MTSNFPVVSNSGFTAQAQSLGVAGYVAQDHNEGTITYVEYSYARNASRPVAKVLNKKGYYVEPTAENVAVGLLAAKINTTPSSPDYLTQILDGVYDNADARAYPLSSYSYMVVPTEASGSFTEDKGKTLGAFAYYFLCEGQQKADSLGYSPLPKNLVQAGFDQIRRIPGVVAQNVDLSKCHNPTFSASGVNLLAKNAPFPPACDKAGPTQCTTGTGGAKAATANSGGATAGTGTTGTTPGTTGSVAAPSAGPQPGTIDPDTGQTVAAADPVSAAAVTGTPQNLGASYSTGTQVALMLIAGIALLLVVLAPPLVALLARRRTS
jgi:phosphate transport system substrate-binding protein